MEEEFRRHNYLTVWRCSQIAVEVGVSEQQVRTWFQNRRTRQKKLEMQNGENINETESITTSSSSVQPNVAENTANWVNTHYANSGNITNLHVQQGPSSSPYQHYQDAIKPSYHPPTIRHTENYYANNNYYYDHYWPTSNMPENGYNSIEKPASGQTWYTGTHEEIHRANNYNATHTIMPSSNNNTGSTTKEMFIVDHSFEGLMLCDFADLDAIDPSTLYHITDNESCADFIGVYPA